jgi:ectoine hydroxylase
MNPLAHSGPFTETERFLFDVAGYLIIPDALTSDEVSACLEAAKRVHAPYPQDEWRQLGHTYEQEPAFENLIDHPSVLPKVRALLGDHFILQSSWCTAVPPGFKGQRFHQDGSAPYEFRRLATPTPLVQLRIGYFLTDQSRPNMGNMSMIPCSHNSSVPIPDSARMGEGLENIRHVVTGKPGTALMFHQGVYHNGGPNEMDFHRYIIHMVYAPPWLLPSDRKGNAPEFLARTTPLRRALLGEWNRPEEAFGVGYERPPFEA